MSEEHRTSKALVELLRKWLYAFGSTNDLSERTRAALLTADGLADEPSGALNVAPIAKVTVWAHLPPQVQLYAPGLPPGEHDLFPVPLNQNGALQPHALSEPPSDREGFYTMSQISYALNRSLYAKTGNLSIEAIIEDLHAALRNGGDHPHRNSETKEGCVTRRLDPTDEVHAQGHRVPNVEACSQSHAAPPSHEKDSAHE